MTMREGWKRVPIATLYEGLYDGPHGTPPVAEAGPIFLGIGNITEDGHLDLSAVKHIAPSDFPKWTKRVTPRGGDIVFTYEATLNRYAIIPEQFDGCLGRRLALIRPDRSKVDTRFLHYSFFSSSWRETIERNRLAGATVDRIPLSKFPVFPIDVPELPVQHRIAGILSAYDDLIEVNQRRIAILEEMARRLFDEWFVRFRYPGHEAVPLVETELGSVPKGWDHGTVSNLSGYISRGISPKYDDGASCRVINQKCIRAQAVSLEPARRQSKPVPADKFVLEGDVLINSTGVGTLGRVAQVLNGLNETTVDSHVTIARAASGIDASFFGLQLLALQEHFERQGVGATGQTELSKKAIADAALVIPPNGLMQEFGRHVQPIRKQAELLRTQNTRLRAARDLLLPKLISGEIDVGRAEGALSRAAE